MKTIYQITLLSLLSILLYSCQKEKASIEITKDILFSEKIENMDLYLTEFKAKMSSPLKSEEMLSLEDARWHLSAVLNFSYADAKTHYQFFPVDTFYTTLSLYNHQVSLQALNNAFNELSGFITSAYHAIESDDKTLIVAEVGIESIDNNEAEAWVVSTMGYNPPLVGPTFGETDWWFWGDRLGKCGDYTGFIGLDATTQLTIITNLTIPVHDGRVYFTDIEFINLIPLDLYDDDNPYGYYGLWISQEPLSIDPYPCLFPDELNYYRSNIIAYGAEYKPSGKDLISFLIQDFKLFVQHNTYPFHGLELKYGILNTTPTLPDL